MTVIGAVVERRAQEGGLARHPSNWLEVTPASVGFSDRLEECFDSAQRAGALKNLHGLVVVRQGMIAFERYFPGIDNARGRPLGQVSFGPETLHDLRSVTKSIVGLLYGIALSEGKVAAPADNLLGQLPEYSDLAQDPERSQWSIAHVLSMTMGIEWDENGPYIDARNSEIAMDLAADPVRFVLERRIVTTPGQRWRYCGGATALLGALISRGTGENLHAYARGKLFKPLGIAETEWVAAADGVPFAASGLRMRPRDIARIGQLLIQGGTWEGESVVPRSWLRDRIEPVAVLEDGRRFAKHWYIGRFETGSGANRRVVPWSGAIGNGGQRLFVMPELDLVAVITAGNYNVADQGRMPLMLMREIILPNLRLDA